MLTSEAAKKAASQTMKEEDKNMAKIKINYDSKIRIAKRYHKKIFWKKGFNADVVNLAKTCTHFSAHLWHDYLMKDIENRKNEHDFTLEDINNAWQKVIKNNMEILEVGYNKNGKCVSGLIRIDNVDNEHDLFIVFWNCDNGICEIHTCYKVLSKYRNKRDVNPLNYNRQ